MPRFSSTQRLFHLAYCGGLVVDARNPLQGAHRVVSLTLASGFTCMYLPLLRALHAGWGLKVPDAAFYAPLVGIVALAWFGLKRLQFGYLRVAQTAVARGYSRRQIKYRGWTIADYNNWP
jgi:hypothetical protein